MQLTHIKLSGFKSFVDQTNIPVPGQLVAVIGPNGCGKSNVIDAIRWVLGEASAKQLRGQSMQDVIFNGTTTRKATSRTVVELVFDNSDHQLQGNWGQYTEVSIKRTLTRQGDSHYYINNQIVRKRDITDLFLGTGVGARGYAIIEQGMISRIIEAKPEELRSYLEEAAGVSKYKERRRETEQRLQDTQVNLNRLHDLQTELERQIEKLKEQAKVATHYQELKQSLNDKQNLLTFIRFKEAETAKQQTSLLIQSHQTELAQIETLLVQSNEEAYQNQLAEHDTQEQLHQTQNQWALTREQRARLEEKIRYQQDIHQRLNDEKLKTDRELDELQQSEKKLQQQIDTLEIQLTEQQYVLEAHQIQLETIQDQLPEKETLLQQLESEFFNKNHVKNQKQREYDLSQQNEQQLNNQLESVLKRQQSIQDEITLLDIPSIELISIAEESLIIEQNRQESLEAQIYETEQNLSQLEIQQQDCQQQFNHLNIQVATLAAQKNALEQLSHREEQNHTRFWEEHHLNNASSLWQEIQVPQKWQHALNQFLGERLYARSVELDPLDLHPQDQTVWINPQAPQIQTPPIQTQTLRSQIQASAPFDIALDVWLDNIICADNLNEALNKADTLATNQRFITPEGHLIDSASVFWQGSTEQKNQLTWQEDIAQFEKQLTKIEPFRKETLEKQQSLEKNISTHKQQLTELKIQLKTYGQALHSAHQHHTQLLTKKSQTQLRQQQISQEQETLKKEQINIKEKIEETQLQTKTHEAALENLNQDDQNTQATRTELQQELQNIRTQMYDTSRRLGGVQIEEQKLTQQIEHLKQQLEQTRQKCQSLNERQSELSLEFNENNPTNEALTALEQIIESQTELEETLSTIQDQLRQRQENNKNIQKKQTALSNDLQKKQQECHQKELEQQQIQLLAERLDEDLKKNHAQIAPLHEQLYHSPSLEKLSEEVVQLAQKIERLGAVNLVALEELSQSQERQDYFNAQRDDLSQAVSALNSAIAQIDNESKMLFEQTFNAVNEKIQEYFPTLFGGGYANLEMVGDDFLNSGLSIMAHPPGKKNSSIHLLSGGEKALTAMSLVFALFSLNPAPFCLLDEVDAPLDDANTTRFCQLVQKMSKQTQFLFISHNRLTMQMADQLIGVTMQEKGVSRIVSVDIQEAFKMQDNEDANKEHLKS